MGVEYYILKNSNKRKECFYLGKDTWYNLEGILYNHFGKAEYSDWEDVVLDIVRAGCYESLDTMEYITILARYIYDFVFESDVRLANDCEEDISWLNEYTEVNSIIDVCREVYGDC